MRCGESLSSRYPRDTQLRMILSIRNIVQSRTRIARLPGPDKMRGIYRAEGVDGSGKSRFTDFKYNIYLLILLILFLK